MDRTVPFLNGCVSFVVFITTLTLVLYMVIAFATGVFDVVQLMRETVLLDPADRQLIFKSLNSDFLHNVAILVILIKAYRILVEYMRYRHINLKFMVEITIIACVLELLFNFHYYTPDMRIILGVMGITFLFVYAFKYDVLVKSALSTQQQANNNPLPEKHPDLITSKEIVANQTKTVLPSKEKTKVKTKKRSSTKAKQTPQ